MEKKKYNYHGHKVTLKKSEYNNNGTLALLITYENGEDEVLTVNLNHPLQSDSMAFLDTNNNPQVEKFIRQNHLGLPMYVTQQSGFCKYPLYTIF